MKINKNLFYLFISSTLLFASCAEEDDNLPGDDRDQYTGSWLCKETPAGMAPTTFTINISKTGISDSLFVSNFDNLGANEKALFIVSGNSVAIPFQDVSGFSVTDGSGTLSDGKILLSYKVDNESYTAECTQ